MVIHSSLSGADLHDPRGTNGDPLVFPLNTANVLQWEDTNGDSYFNVSTATGFEGIIFGNATSNPSFAFVGSGEPNAALWTVNQRASSPSSSLLKGKVYGLQVGGTGPTELHYIDSAGNVTQITSVGTVSGGGGGGTLDAAYDYGGAHLGRQVNIDTGFPVQLTASGVADVALEITGHIAPTHAEVVIGSGSHLTIGSNAIIIGSGAQAGANSVACGFSSSCSGVSSTAVGAQTTASHAATIVIGRTATSSAANQVTVGSGSYYVTEAVFGGGNTDANARSLDIRASNGVGTNIAGWDLSLSAGRGTGSAPGGAIYLRSSIPNSSGTTIRDGVDLMGVDPDITGASPNGEARIACNDQTEPLKFSQGAVSVASASSGTVNLVNLASYAKNSSSVGWVTVQFTLLAQGGTTIDTQHVVNSFVLDSTGALTVGTTKITANVDDAGILNPITVGVSTTTLQVSWSATGSDNYDIVWSAQWHYGPATPA